MKSLATLALPSSTVPALRSLALLWLGAKRSDIRDDPPRDPKASGVRNFLGLRGACSMGKTVRRSFSPRVSWGSSKRSSPSFDLSAPNRSSASHLRAGSDDDGNASLAGDLIEGRFPPLSPMFAYFGAKTTGGTSSSSKVPSASKPAVNDAQYEQASSGDETEEDEPEEVDRDDGIDLDTNVTNELAATASWPTRSSVEQCRRHPTRTYLELLNKEVL